MSNSRSPMWIGVAGVVIGILTATPSVVLIYDRLFEKVQPIEFGATDHDRIVNYNDVGASPYTAQLGMLHNRIVDDNLRIINDTARPNSITYRVNNVKKSGTYNLQILYASKESRPVSILLNEDFVSTALYDTTTGWDNDDRKWSPSYRVMLKAGENILQFRSDDKKPVKPFPHLSRIRLIYTEN